MHLQYKNCQFKMLRYSFIHFFVERGVFCVCLFTATELSSCMASFETTGNLETSTCLRWLWICWCRCDFCPFMFRWTRYHTNLEQVLKKKIAKIYVKVDTQSWKIFFFSLHDHSETVINLICQLFWEKTTTKIRHRSCKICPKMALCFSISEILLVTLN